MKTNWVDVIGFSLLLAIIAFVACLVVLGLGDIAPDGAIIIVTE